MNELLLAKNLIRAPFAWGLIAVLLAAFLALFFSLQAGVFLLLFALVAWWTWENPEEGFLLFIVLAPVLPMLKITQSIGTVTLIKDVIIIALFLKLFFVPLLTKKLPSVRNILIAPIVAIILWSVIATLRADSMILGILRLRDIGLYVLLYFAVLYLTHDKETMRRRLKWFSLSVVVLLLLGVWQWFYAVDSAVLRFDPIRSIWIPRISSVMAHPSIFGEYMVMAAGLFGALLLFLKDSKQRIQFGLLGLVCVPFIFLTYSRAVWIGFVVAAVVMALVFVSLKFKTQVSKFLSKRSLALVLVLLFVIFAVLIRFTPVGVYVRAVVDPTYGSNEERIEFFVRLVSPITRGEVIVGRGLGDVLEQNFREVDLEVIDIASGASRSVQLTKNRTLVDNQYLKSFIELGVIGIVFYLWLYWRIFVTAIRGVRNKVSGVQHRVIALWTVGFLAAFVVQALFIDIWDIFPTNAAFWIMAALLSQEG